jgi:hypothetical protein
MHTRCLIECLLGEVFFFIESECHRQGIQGRRQPAPGHSLGSLKNKGRMVKNKISFDPNILFIRTGHPLSIVSGSALGHRYI